jgi:hypothetical protein
LLISIGKVQRQKLLKLALQITKRSRFHLNLERVILNKYNDIQLQNLLVMKDDPDKTLKEYIANLKSNKLDEELKGSSENLKFML